MTSTSADQQETTFAVIAEDVFRSFKRTIENEDTHVYAKINVVIHRGIKKTKIQLIAILQLTPPKIMISDKQINLFSDPTITNLECDKWPGLWDLISSRQKNRGELSFTQQARESLYVPVVREATLGIILAFYNETRDPLDRIRELTAQAETPLTQEEQGRLLATYYMSCLSYILDTEFSDIVNEGSRIAGFADDQLVIPPDFRVKYDEMRENRNVAMEIIAFQAIYGAYLLCRPITTRTNFSEWIGKRYNSFLSSVNLPPAAQITLSFADGGRLVNHAVLSRPAIKRAVWKVINLTGLDDVQTAVVSHIRLLVSYSDMTAYTLVNNVIVRGGAICVIGGNAELLKRFLNERKQIFEKLARDGYSDEDIQFIKLIYPSIQCFKTNDYATFVAISQIMEDMEMGSKSTLKAYKYKNQDVHLDEAQIRRFLTLQKEHKIFTIDMAAKHSLAGLMGEDAANALFEQASAIIKVINRQRGIGMDL